MADKVVKKIEAKIVLGDLDFLEDKEPSPTFKEYSDIWIKVTVPATCKPSTAASYKGLLDNHILQVFKNKHVSEINRNDIKSFLMKKYKSGVAASTVGHMKSVLSGVLNMAVDDEVILANPTHRIGKIFRVKHIQDNISPLTRKELTLLLDAFKKHKSSHYPMALLLARTGMRLGEVLALQWGDIDFNGRVIRVARTLSLGKVETPKRGKSRRVDMSKQLTKVLSELKTQRKLQTLKEGWKQVPDWVFINAVGKPLDINHWRRRVFEKVLEKAKLRKIRVHDLRHTYASLLIQAGESLVYVRD
ncbi:tyrosine-type recombinase/integrase, partial [Thermodesulfobacteriota bacterium]